MRRPLVATTLAAVILAAATAGGLMVSACGGSSESASAAQTESGEPAGQPPDMSPVFRDALDPLVQDGTISSDQESAVIDALSSSGPGGRSTGGQPSPGSTPPSGQPPSDGATPPSGGRQGALPDPSRMYGAVLDDLVSAGAITATQQAAINEALGSAMQQAAPPP